MAPLLSEQRNEVTIMKKEKEELKGAPTISAEPTTNSVSNGTSNEAVIEADKKPSFLKRFWKGFLNFFHELGKNEMFRYVIKRLLLLVFTFVIIFLICFVLVRLLPVDANTGMNDPQVFYNKMVAQGRYIAVINEDGTKTYMPTPILQQLWTFIANLFSGGDHPWGYSYKIAWLQSPVEILTSHLTPTILINVYTMVIAVPLGLGLGIFMALRKNHWEDHFLSVLIMLVISVPSFVYAFLLQYNFGYVWQTLPPMAESASVGYFSPEYFRSIILPILSMSFGSIAGYARYTRAELTEVLTSDFMLLARTKGLSRAQATVRHAFRNSLVPIFPMILGELISILSGSMIIENIFRVNGVGGLYLDSIQKLDYDVFQFVSMFYILIGLIGTLVVDLSYGIVDPRIRMGGKK